MKIWFFSDLHLESAALPEPLAIPDADVCVVAGDLCNGPAVGVRWLAENIGHAMPCVYVAGNHEFYGGSIKEGLEDGRRAAKGFSSVHFLENDVVNICGVRFLGATLWTDYCIDGQPHHAMAHARDRMNDHHKIALQLKPWKRFVPEAAYRFHQDSRLFLETALTADPSPTVVVTHHAPHRNSIPARLHGDLLNAAYASDLTDVIEAGRPALWIHGHLLEACDYRVGSTRVLCSPKGSGVGCESFEPQLIVSL
jgi:Icc-related predicted phosphoesterase